MAIRIIGAGLAGSEAAWQAANRGISVELIEMRPTLMTKAHRTGRCAELVCSNSFRGSDLTNAVGLLKEELRRCGSIIMEAAEASKVPAGGALAVDRDKFSSFIDTKVRNHPLITFVEGHVTSLPSAERLAPLIVATGPLTSAPLAAALQKLVGSENLAFFDAISPIITAESLDQSVLFRQSRYEKGNGDDYLNIPLTREEYYEFVEAVRDAEKFGGHEEVESDMVDHLRPFEGCMPIEEMIERGPDTLLFGPMKPVGLTDPRTGERPFAVIQLRQDDQAGTLWSMVGFQTRLRHGEQLRIFRSLPGLQNADFVRLGTVHRNTFLDSPKCLAPTLEVRKHPGVFLAGQITGVEGYVESTAGGLVAGLNATRATLGEEPIAFPIETAIGALMNYISDPQRTDFQPMNISFGLMPSYFETENDITVSEPAKANARIKKLDKGTRRKITAERALAAIDRFSSYLSVRSRNSSEPTRPSSSISSTI